MIRYLLRTNYVYVIYAKRVIYARLIKKFWDTAHTAINEYGEKLVRGFITKFRTIKVSKQSIREALRLGDNG